MQPELTEQILLHIAEHGAVDTLDLVPLLGHDHQKIVGALKSIEANDAQLVRAEPAARKTWALTAEGQAVAEHGSHEACVFHAIPADGIAQADLMKVCNVDSEGAVIRGTISRKFNQWSYVHPIL